MDINRKKCLIDHAWSRSVLGRSVWGRCATPGGLGVPQRCQTKCLGPLCNARLVRSSRSVLGRSVWGRCATPGWSDRPAACSDEVSGAVVQRPVGPIVPQRAQTKCLGPLCNARLAGRPAAVSDEVSGAVVQRPAGPIVPQRAQTKCLGPLCNARLVRSSRSVLGRSVWGRCATPGRARCPSSLDLAIRLHGWLQGAAIIGNNTDWNGGGVAVDGGDLDLVSSSLTLDHTLLQRNTSAGSGGALKKQGVSGSAEPLQVGPLRPARQRAGGRPRPPAGQPPPVVG